MLAFTCQVCGQLLIFENSLCLRCGTELGFVPTEMDLVPLRVGRDQPMRRCANGEVAGCNWLLGPEETNDLCRSCRLTRTRPPDGDQEGLAAFRTAEGAKRRLLFELLDLGLPVDQGQLRFDLLSSAYGPVTTGHADGLITIDLSESDPALREQRRTDLDEPYRTVLGHFRHEIAHYYWPIVVEAAGPQTLERYRELFGDERDDYAAALDRHYHEGPPPDWADRHVSAYATMHSWEDWAETFAHYLHIRDALQTGAAYGLVVAGPAPEDPTLMAVPEIQPDEQSIEAMIDAWLPFTYALNAVNRSMGRDDLYPFTLAPRVIEKLGFVHDAIRVATA